MHCGNCARLSTAHHLTFPSVIMRITSRLALLALLCVPVSPVFAFSKEIAVTAADFSSDFDTVNITLSRDPGEKVTVLYDLYIGDSLSSHAGGGVNTYGQYGVTSGLSNNFEAFGGAGTRFRLQFRVCPYDEPYTGLHQYLYCSREFVTYVTYDPNTLFTDVPSTHLHAEAIAYVKAKGIVDGYPDGTFRPNHTINRAEFTKIVIGSNFTERALQFCADFGFSDTSRTAWYASFICLAAQHHIIDGYPDGSFHPEASINFVEAAKIIATVDNFYINGVYYNDVLANGVRVGLPLPEGRTGSWFEPYVLYLAEKNAIPVSIDIWDHQITRGEMAEIIYRLREKITNQPSLEYEEIGPWKTDQSDQEAYTLIDLPTHTIKNYALNTVYRYAITAPTLKKIVINGQSFAINGGRWTGPQLGIFSDASFTGQIDTWASDDNWTFTDTAALKGSLAIPRGETRYLQLTVTIGTPADMGFLVKVQHPLLREVTLTGK